MKKFIAALSCVLMLAMAPQVHAFQSPLTDPKDRAALEAVAKAMKIYAEDLGCSLFSWGNITSMGGVYQLQFIPTGTDPNNWKQRVQMNVYGLTGDAAADRKLITRLIGTTLSSYQRSGAKILQNATYTDVHYEPLLFVEYETVQPPYSKPIQPEHGAGVLKRPSKNTAAFILMQTRGEKISPNQVMSIHRMVNPKAK
jgi:hypothetical protein